MKDHILSMNHSLYSLKRRNCLGLAMLLVLVLSGGASAQEAASPDSLGGYNAMRIDSVGLLVGSFNGSIEKMTEGVHITLLSDDPEMEPLPIRAQSMNFNWPEGASTPQAIVMQGNVEIQHPQASVSAQHAEWDFDKGELVFSGNPIMNNDRIKGLHGEIMILNFEANTFEVRKVTAEEVPIQSSGESAPGSSDYLRAGEITDLPALINIMKEQSAAPAASPGKQVLAQVDPDLRGALMSASTEALLAQEKVLLKQLNKVLKSPKLYEASAWEGIALSEAAQALLAQESLTAAEQVKLNRLLLEAAYPNYIKARP